MLDDIFYFVLPAQKMFREVFHSEKVFHRRKGLKSAIVVLFWDMQVSQFAYGHTFFIILGGGCRIMRVLSVATLQDRSAERWCLT
jgi:hypothetical protein